MQAVSGHARRAPTLALDEVLMPLALAETGTACRTAERVIGRWDQDFRQDDPGLDEDRQPALDPAPVQAARRRHRDRRARDRRRHADRDTLGLVDEVTETRADARHRPAQPHDHDLPRDPARVLHVSRDGAARRRPAGTRRAWPDYQRPLLERFDKAFPALLLPVLKPNGDVWPLNAELRSLSSSCACTSASSPRGTPCAGRAVDDELTLTVLDDDAVERMSAWLATEVDGRQRGDGNTIGSRVQAGLHPFVEACRRTPAPPRAIGSGGSAGSAGPVRRRPRAGRPDQRHPRPYATRSTGSRAMKPDELHALLIGIDAYDGGGHLQGCVNDVDAIQGVLLDRLGVPPRSG